MSWPDAKLCVVGVGGNACQPRHNMLAGLFCGLLWLCAQRPPGSCRLLPAACSGTTLAMPFPMFGPLTYVQRIEIGLRPFPAFQKIELLTLAPRAQQSPCAG
jgi:hypothetical protein